MLTEFTVEDFRSIGKLTWKPEALNVLIGPNASGKTNLLRAFECLAASARGELSDYVSKSGGFETLSRLGRRRIRFAATFAPFSPYSEDKDEVRYELELASLRASHFRVERESLVNRAGLHLLYRDLNRATIFSTGAQAFEPAPQSLKPDETLLSIASGPLAAALNPFVTKHRDELADWSVYKNFATDQSAPVRRPQVARADRRLDADGQNLLAVLHSLYAGDPAFESDVNDAMRAAFGAEFVKLTFPPAADQLVQMRAWWNGAEKSTTMADLSDGTFRFLYLAAILANPTPAPIIAIDEPELGLHPMMLPIVADFARAASEKSQVVLATHSPDLLAALGQEGPPSTLVFERRDGETIAKSLDRDDLNDWLKRYSLGDLYRTGELEAME